MEMLGGALGTVIAEQESDDTCQVRFSELRTVAWMPRVALWSWQDAWALERAVQQTASEEVRLEEKAAEEAAT